MSSLQTPVHLGQEQVSTKEKRRKEKSPSIQPFKCWLAEIPGVARWI